MLVLRPSGARGHYDHGWLNTFHTFSFADYHDPAHMGFRVLRVINEDRVKAGEGFGTHPHRDMEILSYVISGELEHRDSMGNGSVIRPGDVQRMTAGTGVAHSEYNPSQEEPVHFLQIWVLPEARGLRPSYEQKRFEPHDKRDRLRLVASRGGTEGSVSWNQDVSVYASLLSEGLALEHRFSQERYGWLQVVSGNLTANRLEMSPGDGLAISNQETLTLLARSEAEFLLFDLP